MRSITPEKPSPPTSIAEVYDRIGREPTQPVWISLVSRETALARARELESDPSAFKLPLYGIPFAIKDNIDLAGVPTTAGCPAYAYSPERNATVVVERLLDAGAIPIGKTNLDQFATGLVGTRSPHGACSSVFDARYISGGSSSGSAVAVAKELVSFSLGTDTAGSGRIPAAFNNLVGLKPFPRLAQRHWRGPRVPLARLCFNFCGELQRCANGVAGGQRLTIHAIRIRACRDRGMTLHLGLVEIFASECRPRTSSNSSAIRNLRDSIRLRWRGWSSWEAPRSRSTSRSSGPSRNCCIRGRGWPSVWLPSSPSLKRMRRK